MSIIPVLAMFFVTLLLAESSFYAVTGKPVSPLAMLSSALVAALLFAPIVRATCHWLDRWLFHRRLDLVEAIQYLGSQACAGVEPAEIEQSLLRRVCKLSRRKLVALDERGRPNGSVHVFPIDAPLPPEQVPANVRLGREHPFELCLNLPVQDGVAYLYLGQPIHGGSGTDQDELTALKSVAQMIALTLEHARLSRKQVEHAKLDSLHRIASQLHSHDLKNRLHDLSFLAHNLQGEKLDAEETTVLVQAISKVTGRMHMLLQRLSDPSAPLEPQFLPLSVNQWINDCIKQRLWPEKLHVHISETINTMSDTMIIGDLDMLRGVLETLFDNAMQAMNKQGDIFVDAVVRTDDAARPHGILDLSVRDTGIGMDALFIKQHLFTLFATSKDDGLGIGLYLSRRIVQAHGGDIRASSLGKGNGCTFVISVPLWQDEPPKE
ncbi:MAG: HAMP domain-containing sensor histidine kinase [Mariprofundales bacterium]